MEKLDIISVQHIPFLTNDRLFYTYWSPTNLCNYNCDYCNITHKSPRERLIPFDQQKKIIEFINYISGRFCNVVELYGGEPTLDPNIIKIFEALENEHNIRLFTNLSYDYRGIAETGKRTTITASFHFHKAEFNKFVENLRRVLSLGFYKVIVKVMLDSRYKDQILRCYKQLEEEFIHVPNFRLTLNIILDSVGSEWSDDEINEYLDKHSEFKDIHVEHKGGVTKKNFNEIWLKHLEKNHYYRCEVGKKSLFINSNGDVYYCKNFFYHPHDPLFNVIQDDYRDHLDIFDKGIICPSMGFCVESKIPKYRVMKRIRRVQ